MAVTFCCASRTRSRPEYETAIHDDLHWLGLDWEEPVRRQSDHFGDYRSALDMLIGKGLVYPSFLSRKDADAITGGARPLDPAGARLHPAIERNMDRHKAARRLASGENHALRINMEKALNMTGPELTWTELGLGIRETTRADPAAWGDVIIARKETPTSYHLSVTVDDAFQGVTHVVRGMDLYHATSIHRLLQTLLGLPEPIYHHHPLISAEDGRKLSKSAGSPSLRDLRRDGVSPAAIRKRLGF
jgi:glutamyl-Q tRNA(Asp) synthetase